MAIEEVEERIIYDELKNWMLMNYFDDCRDYAFDKGWTYSQIVSTVHDGYEGSFSRPIENLMLELIALILTGGWNQQTAEYHRKQITELLSKYQLSELLDGVPEEEAKQFEMDLRKMKFLEAK